MLLPGTQMHIITFLFVCIEVVILCYLLIYRLARPDDKTAYLNIILIFLLVVYNVTGGLLPDENLPGSYFIQMAIAYATGFITPCYFPYYVYKAFGLEKMKFHAYKGVFFFLISPYILFVIVFSFSKDINFAKDLLILPVVYALWVIFSLAKALRYKHNGDFSSKEAKEEVTVLFLSLTPWVGLPVIDFLNLGQGIEASITNIGFLLLFALQLKGHIAGLRTEHERLVTTEQQLLNWNTTLQDEVAKRTNDLEKINEQRTNTFVNLAHETKTPLTLITNYLDEYLYKNEQSEELLVVKKSIDKLTSDIVNFFDVEKFNKGIIVYNHNLVSDFSSIIKETLALFEPYANKRMIKLSAVIEHNVYVKADPSALNRVVNNLIENAIKFSADNSNINITLNKDREILNFSVQDFGIGIPGEYKKKVFEPYFQITNKKANGQGMGLGLPIVKKIVEELKGSIAIRSKGKLERGTEIVVSLKQYQKTASEVVTKPNIPPYLSSTPAELKIENKPYNENEKTILVVEDNISMANYLSKKLCENYNVYTALNGNEALKQLKEFAVLPDLIISDVMMDKMDGYAFAKIISKHSAYGHIPFIFITAKSAPTDRYEGLRLGAIDYVQKPFLIQELLGKIDSILAVTAKQKKSIIDTAFASLTRNENRNVPGTVHSFGENCQIYNLSAREKEVAELICRGLKYKAIADTLFIAERTVTKHAQNIFEKVNVSNKIELSNKLEYAGNSA
jgi:signal transduction histidine kinase/DNA-binding NarL/FixJ family response regulator